MMTEQQMTLKSDDLQERWKTCVLTTCYAYRVVERVKEAIHNLTEVVRQIINSLAEVLKPVAETLTTAFRDLVEYVEECNEDSNKSYPQGYPHYVDNSKFNSRGYPMTIRPCARSRC